MYSGYLIKINNVIFPLKYIKVDTYECTPNQTLDEDSYTDGDGVLNREILPHTRTKIEFTTPELKERDLNILRTFLENRLRTSVTYYNTLTGNYDTGTCYIPEPTFSIYGIKNGEITYKSIRIAIIEY